MSDQFSIDPNSDLPDSAFERAMLLQNMLVSLATGQVLQDDVFAQLRSEFMSRASTRELLPAYVRTCRDGSQLWDYFKNFWTGSGAYSKRRQHIRETFEPLLEHLEGRHSAPGDADISKILASIDPDGVHSTWERALERRHSDPEGAITAARTLLETVCKHIIEEGSETYGANDDLPKLYGQTAKILNLAPSQHTEEAFKAILGSCHTIVQNLGTLRNRIGDAHGQGRIQAKPSPRHAALAVNLAGSMATFLVETWQARQQS